MGDEKISPSEGQSCESEVTSIGVTTPEGEHAVDMAGEGKVPGVKSKKNLLKKIFMPWKWKAKRKSDKFKQRCTILERKISVECAKLLFYFELCLQVRISQKKMVERGLLAPDCVETSWVEEVVLLRNQYIKHIFNYLLSRLPVFHLSTPGGYTPSTSSILSTTRKTSLLSSRSTLFWEALREGRGLCGK